MADGPVIAADPVLRIERLRVGFGARGGTPVPVIEEIDLVLHRGCTLALVGESGSGKSVTGLSVMRLLGPGATVMGGRILLRDADGGMGEAAWSDLLSLPSAAMRAVRGARIGMVFQEPMTALNPSRRIGGQIAESLRLHRSLGRRAAALEAVAMLRRVGIAAPSERARAYPHQLSGGMRQRVLIAMALCCRPDVLIADEPTTALDVTTQAQILALLRDLQDEFGMAILFVTHNLAVVAECADAVAVLYAGRVVEQGPVASVLQASRHPYTRGLLASLPEHAPASGGRLATIAGAVPPPGRRPLGCGFAPRCALVTEACTLAVPPVLPDAVAPHWARCIHVPAA